MLLIGVPAWHWAIGGAVLASVTLALLWLANRRLGISTSFEDVCAIASRAPYFAREEIRGSGGWRLWFIGGLVIGGALSSITAGGWEPTWAAGLLDEAFGWSPFAKLGWMTLGGLCIGFGTRLAGGCTSGHGLFGLSNLEPASWLSTAAYMTSGVLMTNFVYRVLAT
jgi:uncharacterized protein